MPLTLNAAWWTALGAPSRWAPVWTNYTHAEVYWGSTPAPTWMRVGVNCGAATKFFQAPFVTGAISDVQMSDNNYDTGYFWINVVEV